MSLDILKRDFEMVTTVFFDLYDQLEVDHQQALRTLARIHDNRQTRQNPAKLDYLLHFPRAYSWLDEVEFHYTLDQLKWTVPLEGHQVIAPFNRVDVGRPNTVAQLEQIVAAQPEALNRREIELISEVFHTNPLSVTGRPFFATDHPKPQKLGTFSNLLAPVFGPDLERPPLQAAYQLLQEVITRFSSMSVVRTVYIDDDRIRGNLLVIVHNEKHHTLFRELRSADVLPAVDLGNGTRIGERQNALKNAFRLWRDPNPPPGQENDLEFLLLTGDNGPKPAVYVLDTDPEPVVLEENRVSNGFYGVGFQKIFAVKPFIPNTTIQARPVASAATLAPLDGDLFDPLAELGRSRAQIVVPEGGSLPTGRGQVSFKNLLARFAELEQRLAEITPEREPPAVLLERLAEMEREELEALHEDLLKRKPHGNARDESVRDAVRQALEALLEPTSDRQETVLDGREPDGEVVED